MLAATSHKYFHFFLVKPQRVWVWKPTWRAGWKNPRVWCKQKDSEHSMSNGKRVYSHSPSTTIATQHRVALQHCPGSRVGAVPQRTGDKTGTSTHRQTCLFKSRGFNPALTQHKAIRSQGRWKQDTKWGEKTTKQKLSKVWKGNTEAAGSCWKHCISINQTNIPQAPNSALLHSLAIFGFLGWGLFPLRHMWLIEAETEGHWKRKVTFQLLLSEGSLDRGRIATAPSSNNIHLCKEVFIRTI